MDHFQHLELPRCQRLLATYTPFQSHTVDTYFGGEMAVVGIGTVEIEVKRRRGKVRDHAVRLLSVLHAP